MMFVYPAFLWALATVSIPIIIHLFNFRRYKKIYFTNVKFLKELELESRSKSRLKELLILAARILAITAIVLAFAQPVIKDKNRTPVIAGNKLVGIYIDNSFSMEAVNKRGPLLENAKITAQNIVNLYQNNDQFHLITNDFKGIDQRLYSKEDVLQEISEIKTSASSRMLSDVLKRQTAFLLEQAKEIKLYALSDFQKSTFNISELKNDTSLRLSMLNFVSGETQNIYIDSVWFETPVQQKDISQKLHVIIKNNSEKSIEAGSLKVIVNGNQVAIGTYSLDSRSGKEITVNFTCKTEGLNYASVKIDDYPIVFDDEMFFTFNTKPSIHVITINGRDNETEKYFHSLFGSDSLFQYQSLNESSIDFSKLKNADLVVLNELHNLSDGLTKELLKFSEKGGCVVFIPSKNLDQTETNTFLQSFQLPSISGLDTQKVKLNKPDLLIPFFEGVFEKLDPQINLPIITKHYQFTISSRSRSQNIYSLINGHFFLSENTFSNCKFYVFSSSFHPKNSNFCNHALFVPTFIRMAVNSLKPHPLFYTIGDQEPVFIKPEYNPAETPPRIIGKNQSLDIIPEIKTRSGDLALFVGDAIKEAGFYDVVWANQIKRNLAYNHNRKESVTDYYLADELNEIIKLNNLKYFSVIDAGETKDTLRSIQMGAGGIKLWKWFIILSLLFLSVEICLIRFLK